MLAALARYRRLRYLVKRLGTCFVTLRTGMHQLEQRDRPIISTGRRGEALQYKGE